MKEHALRHLLLREARELAHLSGPARRAAIDAACDSLTIEVDTAQRLFIVGARIDGRPVEVRRPASDFAFYRQTSKRLPIAGKAPATDTFAEQNSAAARAILEELLTLANAPNDVAAPSNNEGGLWRTVAATGVIAVGASVLARSPAAGIACAGTVVALRASGVKTSHALLGAIATGLASVRNGRGVSAAATGLAFAHLGALWLAEREGAGEWAHALLGASTLAIAALDRRVAAAHTLTTSVAALTAPLVGRRRPAWSPALTYVAFAAPVFATCARGASWSASPAMAAATGIGLTHWFTGRHDSAFALALPVEAASLIAAGAGAAAPVIGSLVGLGADAASYFPAFRRGSGGAP